MKKIYLAGPLFDCNENEKKEWRELCKKELNKKFILLDPMRNKFKEEEITHRNEIVNFDLVDIMNCDIVLANCWKVSVGTSIEIFFAHQNHKIVVVVGKEEKLSPWIIYHATKILPTIEDGIKYIKEKL